MVKLQITAMITKAAVSNFSYIKPVPKSAVFYDITPCTLAEYLSTQCHIQAQSLNFKQCALFTYLR